MMNGSGDGWWLAMWLWMAAAGLLAVAGAAWFLTAARSRRPEDGSAPALLDRRLAAGEITIEEHRRLRAELTDGRPGRRRSSRNFGTVLGVVAVLAALLFFAMPAWAMVQGDWDMWDHMDGMMGRGRNTASGPLTVGGTDESITIQSFAFSPGNLQIPEGATVTWTNRDSAPHDATSRDGSWETDRLSEDESDTLTFDRAGEYDYYCSIHPSMKARISVR